MNSTMAVQAGPPNYPLFICSGTAEKIASIIDRRAVRSTMAVSAQLGWFLGQQSWRVGAVGFVAFRTIFFNRQVLPHIRSTLLGVTLVAELVDVFGLDAAVAQGTVGIVAVGTLDLALDDRVMGKFVGLCFNIFVTFKAFFWLLR